MNVEPTDDPDNRAFAVGLDIGGASIVAGVISRRDGRILSRTSIPTDSRRGHVDGLQRITTLVEQVTADAGVSLSNVTGIGVGCTGPVDSVKGLVQNPYTLPGWEDLPLLDHLQTEFGLSTCLLNDCHVAALGEHWMGAGRGCRHMIYITVGTGIGGGLILNGQLYRGNGLLSGEIGHQAIDLNGPECYCGARGCLEMLAAGPAIAAAAAHAAPDDGSILTLAGNRRDAITARIVCQAAEQGDTFAQQIVMNTATYLGIGIANLLNILTPEIVVLGGGVMQSWSLFRPMIEQTIQTRAGMIKDLRIQLRPAALGLNAGITGAAFAILSGVSSVE